LAAGSGGETVLAGGGGETVFTVAGDVDRLFGGGEAGEATERGVVLGVENSDPGDWGERERGVSTGGGVMKTVRLPALPISGGGVDAIVQQRGAEVEVALELGFRE
jgi:hypothetical protein